MERVARRSSLFLAGTPSTCAVLQSLISALEKQTSSAEKYTLQSSAEMFNAFNHQNYTGVQHHWIYLWGLDLRGDPASGYTGPQTYTTELQYNPSFGTYTNSNSNYAYSPRQIQFAARLSF